MKINLGQSFVDLVRDFLKMDRKAKAKIQGF